MRSPRFEASADKVRRLRELQAARKRQLEELHAASATRWETPGDLARVVDPSTVQTEALELIDRALVEAYTVRDSRLIITMPPQEGKSTRVTKVGSLWALIRNPDLRIGICSYAQSLAETFGRDVRTWISSFQGDEDSVDLGLRIARDYGSVKRWKLDGHRGGVVCVGIGSGLTGRPLDALVIDDPLADQIQADSLYFRERVWSWWQSVGAPRLAPGSPVIVILTRWHEDDLAGRLQVAEDGARWKVVNIPALADHDPAKDQVDALGREPGQWLESARGRTAADWEQIRLSVGTRVFTALYQGQPSPDQGNVWHRQWWRRYRVPLWSQHPVVPGAYLLRDVDELVISWDMAFKDADSSDFVAGQVWARKDADVFLVDQVRKRLSFTETLTAFVAMCARWPQATRKIVEDKANGPAVVSLLKSKIPGIVEHTPKGTKYARAVAVSPFIEAGNVFLPDPAIALFDTEEFVTEAASFPNAAHDDQVDAASQGLAEMLLDGSGAEAWLRWIRARAEAIARGETGAVEAAEVAALPAAPLPETALVREVLHAGPEREDSSEPIEPAAVLTPAEARKRARDETFRAMGGDKQW